MKKKLIMVIVAVLLVACVSVTFAVWLGDVEGSQMYTINMTDNFMYLSSTELTIDSGSAQKLTPSTPVTHGFKLNVKGSNAIIKIECTEILFKPEGGDSYIPVSKDAVSVTFDKNNIDVNHGDTEFAVIECKATISFLLPAVDLDNKYENAKFKYTIKISIAEKEVVNG